MKRSLPSSSTNKRKRQDAFIEASPFDGSTPRKVTVNPAGANDATALGHDLGRHKVTNSTAASGSRSKNEGNRLQGIMAFSPMTRGVVGIRRGLPETPSKGSRISSPGLPIPTGFTLLRPSGLPSPAHTDSVSSIRGCLEKAGGSTKGSSLARDAMTPLSSLTAHTRMSGSPSPATGLSKNRSLHPLAQPDLFASHQTTGNDGILSERAESGLRSTSHKTLLSIAHAPHLRYTMESGLDASAGQEMTRSKGKAAE
ncbi:hypothetical protein QFC22_002403 [Naganishia vaughanmartiniae]|uniref:Uncharacterized protein n=1 Tax=Naganishia vaughanmartiniae TaxID=1424756 RepID=A0ACC2XFH3_9TREE|nr:hypothetical protein QFC22_002403 [Naganishia vaughanmartiniae]